MRLLPVLIPLVATCVGMVGAIVCLLGFLRPRAWYEIQKFLDLTLK